MPVFYLDQIPQKINEAHALKTLGSDTVHMMWNPASDLNGWWNDTNERTNQKSHVLEISFLKVILCYMNIAL